LRRHDVTPNYPWPWGVLHELEDDILKFSKGENVKTGALEVSF
jgi:hypothetical protein